MSKRLGMIRALSFGGILVSSGLLCSCGIPLVGAEYAVHSVRTTLRGEGPDREGTWNKYGWWKKVADNPPSYVPKSHPDKLPRSGKGGRWMVDQRDGKRLFVPVGDEVLAADARTITTGYQKVAPIRFDAQSGKENLWALSGLEYCERLENSEPLFGGCKRSTGR